VADPIAAAFVVVTADTKPFIAQMEALRLLAAKPIVIPVSALGGGKGASGAVAANTAIAQSLGGVQKSSAKAAQGMLSASQESNLFRGSLIGLARVTPVAVFGLGVIGTAAIAAGLAIKSSIGAAADLEQSLNVFQAVSGATVEQMAAVSAQAKALGADLTLPATSANDAATAMTELAKAGLTVNDTLAASRGVMQLAAAANITAGQAATITATQLNAFGLAGSEATKITDLLAGASVAAQGEITDFATAFQQVSAVAHQVGVPIEETTGLLTELAKAGLRGADGGTSLRTTLLRLVPTTKQAAEFQKALGIEIDKSVSVGAQLPDLIEQYRTALLRLTPVQQQEALTQIFGQDAIRAASIIFTQSQGALQLLTAQVSESGSGAKLAEARMKGFSGSVEGLKSAATTLGGTMGATVIPALTSVVKTLSAVTTEATNAANALVKVGDVTVKPVVSKLGGTDTLVPLALAAGAALGIKKLLAMRAASKEAAAAATAAAVQTGVAAEASATIQVAAQARVLTAFEATLAGQRLVNSAYLSNAAASTASTAVQVSNAAKVGTAAGVMGAKILGMNKLLAAGLVASVAGSQVPGEAGGAISSIGNAVVFGSLLGGVPGAIAAGGAATFLAGLNSGKKETSENKAKWDELTYAEQISVLRSIGGVKNGLIGPKAGDFLSTFELTVKPRPSAGTASPAANAAISASIPTIDFSVAPARGGQFAQVAKTFSALFPKAEKFIPLVLPGAKAQVLLARKEQIDLNVSLARLSGSTAELDKALQAQAKFDRKLISTLQSQLVAPNADLSGFKFSLKERTAIAKEIGVAVADLNGVLAETASLANETFTIPTGIKIADIRAGATKGLADDLAAKKSIVAAYEKELATTKATGDALGNLKIGLAEARANVTGVEQQISANAVAEEVKRKQAKADALALVVATAKAAIDLQNARLSNRLAVAKATPGIEDDKSALNAQIAFNNSIIAGLRAEETGLKKTSLKYKEKEAAVQSLIGANIGLRQSIKGLTDTSAGGGFSLSDLFKEGLSQFNQFASNVSTSVATPGGVRGALGGAIAAQNPNLSKADRAKLDEARTTNDFLKEILAAIQAPAVSAAGVAPPFSSAGFDTARSGRLHARLGVHR
jgi:TP901 family phage tail tape measure protein